MAKYKTSILAATLILLGGAVAAQTCLPRDTIVERLEARYQEKLAGRGLRGESSLFEMFTTADGSSWTIIQSFPTGRSCIMAAGTDWQMNDMRAAFAVEG